LSKYRFADFITAGHGFQCDRALILAPDNASIAAAQPLAGMTQSLSGSQAAEKPEVAASSWLLATGDPVR
jgi:hypothetical protein